MRLVSLLKSKIHRATITETNLDYVGSCTIDEELMERVDLMSGELIHVWNVTNGERFETYAIPGPAKSGVICINGSAARKCQKGDVVIIAAFVLTDEPVAPKLALVNKRNEFIAYA
jgi:aspartate 1-decarboxylase